MPTTAGDRALSHLSFLRTGVPAEDAILEAFVRGMATGLERASQVAHGTEAAEAERVLTDPRVCPFWALPHAALWVGSQMPLRPFGMTDADWETYARDYVLAALPAHRGGRFALRDMVKRYLTGAKQVRIVERYQGELHDTLVITKPAETPDPTGLLAAMNAPDILIAGEKISLLVIDGTSWAALSTTTWAQLQADSGTWDGLTAGTYTPH